MNYIILNWSKFNAIDKKIHIHFSFVKKTHDLIEFFGYSYSESDIGQTLEYVKEDDACTCL